MTNKGVPGKVRKQVDLATVLARPCAPLKHGVRAPRQGTPFWTPHRAHRPPGTDSVPSRLELR